MPITLDDIAVEAKKLSTSTTLGNDALLALDTKDPAKMDATDLVALIRWLEVDMHYSTRNSVFEPVRQLLMLLLHERMKACVLFERAATLHQLLKLVGVEIKDIHIDMTDVPVEDREEYLRSIIAMHVKPNKKVH